MTHAAPLEPTGSLYARHRKVQPRAVTGHIRRIKWAVVVVLLALYYLVPWLRWDRGAGVPDQAVLVDIAHGRLFFFWIELWPQEVYFLTGALVLAAIGLFAVTSLFGRVWCGFTCPQTVWTDLFMWVERRIEGDRNARIKLDAEPWSPHKRRLKLTKHAVWIMIAAATGGAWIFYFNDAPSAAWEMLTLQASATVWFFFGLFTLTTYMLAGFAREQVCTYMCPWPRFQGAMLDDQSLVVTYRDWRGEPRGKLKEEGHGDCVDCAACFHVCPTGIDIRDGQQLECIGCGLCVDACNDVMRRLDRPQGLVAFETLANLAASQAATAGMAPDARRQQAGMAARRIPRLLRPRVLMYAGVLSVVIAVIAGAFLLRPTQSLTVLRDRAPLFVQLSDGGVRNAFSLKLVNKTRDAGEYALVMEGAPGVTIMAQGAALDPQGRPLLTMRPDGIAEYRVLATAGPALRLPANRSVEFRLLDQHGQIIARATTALLGPGA